MPFGVARRVPEIARDILGRISDVDDQTILPFWRVITPEVIVRRHRGARITHIARQRSRVTYFRAFEAHGLGRPSFSRKDGDINQVIDPWRTGVRGAGTPDTFG